MHNAEWNDIRVFLAVAEEGTLSGAARRLGVNHSTIYRRVQALEQELGVRLFDRMSDGYALNAAGERMRAKALIMSEAFDDVMRTIGGSDLRLQGELRVATSDTFGTMVLPPIVAAFRKRYPQVSVELSIGSQAVNLSKREADVAVRPIPSPPENLIGLRIGSVQFALYGAPTYLERFPWTPDGCLEGHEIVGFDDSMSHTPIYRFLAERVPPEAIALRTNSVLAKHRMCEAGLGLAFLPCFLGDRSTLRRLTAPHPEMATELWILTHKDLRRTARVKAWLDFAGEELRKLRPLFEGKLG